MEQQKEFASAMFGFNKKVVLDYIYEQDVLAKERENLLHTEAASMLERMDELQDMVEELNSQYEILKAQLFNEKEAAEKQRAAYKKLKSDAEQLAQVARNKDNELQIQLELGKQLQNKAAEQENKIRQLVARLNQLEKENKAAEPILREELPEEKEEIAQAGTAFREVRHQTRELLEHARVKVRKVQSLDEVTKLKEDLASLRQSVFDSLNSFEQNLTKLRKDGLSNQPSSELPAQPPKLDPGAYDEEPSEHPSTRFVHLRPSRRPTGGEGESK